MLTLQRANTVSLEALEGRRVYVSTLRFTWAPPIPKATDGPDLGVRPILSSSFAAGARRLEVLPRRITSVPQKGPARRNPGPRFVGRAPAAGRLLGARRGRAGCRRPCHSHLPRASLKTQPRRGRASRPLSLASLKRWPFPAPFLSLLPLGAAAGAPASHDRKVALVTFKSGGNYGASWRPQTGAWRH